MEVMKVMEVIGPEFLPALTFITCITFITYIT
jgi:hypothetical protein